MYEWNSAGARQQQQACTSQHWATPPHCCRSCCHVTTVSTPGTGQVRPLCALVTVFRSLHAITGAAVHWAAPVSPLSRQSSSTLAVAAGRAELPATSVTQPLLLHCSRWPLPAWIQHTSHIQTEYKKNIHVDGNQWMNLSDVMSLATCVFCIRTKEYPRIYLHSWFMFNYSFFTDSFWLHNLTRSDAATPPLSVLWSVYVKVWAVTAWAGCHETHRSFTSPCMGLLLYIYIQTHALNITP